MSIDIAQYATGYVIPAKVSGQDKPVHIGSCVYGRYRGIFVYKVYGELNALGLKRNGTWAKYGDPFDSAQQALETLLESK